VGLPRSGGSASFDAGLATITVEVTGSTLSVSGSGFGAGDGGSGWGSGGGSGPIVESTTGHAASGPIAGALTVTYDDGTSEDFPIVGSFTAHAPK